MNSAQPAIGVLLLSAVVGVIVGGVIWGVLLKLLSGPIGQKSLSWGPAFKTGFIIAIVSQVLNLVLSLVHPLLALVSIPITFVVAMFAINKFNGIALGRSALIALIAMIAMIVVGFVLTIAVVGIAVALGMAAGATP